MDTDEQLSEVALLQFKKGDSWWKRVKYYAQLVAHKVESGVEVVKQILSTLTSDQRWGVMLEFEEVCPEGFARLVADAPDWVEWMG
ncbi:MAG: hypothetical protein MET45_27270 [Nostoc sp. LLA-1]|nr:hypothetical protein [Cyanocohniella sp. LLY]